MTIYYKKKMEKEPIMKPYQKEERKCVEVLPWKNHETMYGNWNIREVSKDRKIAQEPGKAAARSVRMEGTWIYRTP